VTTPWTVALISGLVPIVVPGLSVDVMLRCKRAVHTCSDLAWRFRLVLQHSGSVLVAIYCSRFCLMLTGIWNHKRANHIPVPAPNRFKVASFDQSEGRILTNQKVEF